jgi:septum formation protein
MKHVHANRHVFHNSSTDHTMQSPNIILASTSKIRNSILLNAGLSFSCQAPSLDEETAKSNLGDISAKNLASELAKLKALSIEATTGIVIGADQTLSCHNTIFHKPESLTAARSQLNELRGETHTLHSALACTQNGKIIWSTCEEAHLTMRNFSDSFLETYISVCGNDIQNAVGGYQLEKQGVQLFDEIEGDYFTILGLPLLPLLTFLRKSGFLQP